MKKDNVTKTNDTNLITKISAAIRDNDNNINNTMMASEESEILRAYPKSSLQYFSYGITDSLDKTKSI